MATQINVPVKAHGTVTYPKLRFVLDSLQFTLDSLITTGLTANRLVATDSSSALVTTVLTYSATALTPTNNLIFTLGDSTHQFNEIHSGSVHCEVVNGPSAGYGFIDLLAGGVRIYSLNTNRIDVNDTLIVIDNLASTGPSLQIKKVSSQLILGGDSSANTVTFTAPTPATTNRTVTLPDLSADYSIVGTEGTQIINGPKTLSSALIITATTNQLVLSGPTRTATITAPQPATSSRTYTFPDLSGNYDVVGTIGTQSIGGSKTLTSALTITTSTANTLVISTDQATTEVSIDNTASDGDPFLSWKLSGTKQFSMGVNDGASDVLQIGTTAIDTSTMWQATSAGEITQPLQPSFLVTDGTGATDVTGDGTDYTELWPTEIYDQGSDFSSNTFTAPVTGRYLLAVNVELVNVLTTHQNRRVRITTSNRIYQNIQNSALAFTREGQGLTVVADMDAGDTAIVTVSVDNSTKTVDILNDDTSNFFSGSLIN